MTNSSQNESSSYDAPGSSCIKIELEVTLSILVPLTSFLDNLLFLYVIY